MITLKELNPDLINYTALDLVDLSRSRSSWCYFIKQVKFKNELSYPMRRDFIEQEDKIVKHYSLHTHYICIE